MKVIVMKVNGVLVPSGVEAQHQFDKMKTAVDYIANITMPRNLKFHKKYFSLVNALFDMQERYDDPQVFRKLLTVAAGHFDNVMLPNGRSILMPKSIAFEKMPEDEFEGFYSKTIDVAINKFGINQDAIMRIIQYV